MAPRTIPQILQSKIFLLRGSLSGSVHHLQAIFQLKEQLSPSQCVELLDILNQPVLSSLAQLYRYLDRHDLTEPSPAVEEKGDQPPSQPVNFDTV